jgi:hypothetical protein
LVLCGGIVGGCKGLNDGYLLTHDAELTDSIVITTVNYLFGFCFGISSTILPPIIIPIGCGIVIIRYFDKHDWKNYVSSN